MDPDRGLDTTNVWILVFLAPLSSGIEIEFNLAAIDSEQPALRSLLRLG